jgi:hypothetical protein
LPDDGCALGCTAHHRSRSRHHPDRRDALAGGLSWFGRLPGDIRYRSNGARIYIPITSMLLASLVLRIAFAVARRLTS